MIRSMLHRVRERLAGGSRRAPRVPARLLPLPGNLLDGAQEAIARIDKERAADSKAVYGTLASYAKTRSLRRLLGQYLANVGGLVHLRDDLYRAIETAAASLDIDPSLRAFDERRRIPSAVVAHVLPGHDHLIFDVADPSPADVIPIWPEARNELFDPSIPGSMAGFRHERRAKLDLCRLAPGTLAIHPYYNAVVSPDGTACMRGTNLKGLSRRILERPRSRIARPMVVLQDYFDSGNLSHFLFDDVTRLFHFCEALPEKARDALFIFGGKPLDFHREILTAAAQILRLQTSQFLFPSEARNLEAPEIFWFSDAALYLHPAHWMHPRSVAVLDRIAARFESVPGGPRRVYISRSDAGHRRLSNENQLLPRLQEHGFASYRMADLTARDQIALLSGAEIVVAPHGMGLTHLAFHRGRPKLVELFHPRIRSHTYALLARAKGFDYVPVFGTEHADAPYDFSIDVDLVLSALGL